MAEKELEDLNKELSTQAPIRKQLEKIYRQVTQGYKDQLKRNNQIIDYWDCYNCKLNHNQSYEDSLSQIYVPIVYNAVEARVTRFNNQLFPQNGRYVEVTTMDGDFPYGHMAILENYIERSDLKTKVMPSMLRNGDIEGQYTVYVSWKEKSRRVRYKDMKKASLDDVDLDIDEFEEYETIEEDEWEEGCPHVEVISDSDFILYPITSDSVDDAIDNGGHATILMRMTEGKVDEMVRQGVFRKDQARLLKQGFGGHGGAEQGAYGSRSMEKEQAAAAGVKVEGNTKVAHVYQTWVKLKVNGEHRMCVVYFGGDDLILSCKLNPYWCDKCPIISTPIHKLSGVGKGVSLIHPIAQLQYMANDAANLGMASGIYALMPIVMTDPEKNPRVGTMLMNTAAIWMTNPNDTQFAEFPKMYQDALQIIDWCKSEAFQALSVNPSMITSGSAYRKPTQAEVANEQQVDILATASAVTIVEEGILTPMVERFFEYDKQFRKNDLIIKTYGEHGQKAIMEKIPPIQRNKRYKFKWFGVEQARTAQQIQQQISAVNVARGIPPQLLPGRKLDLVPVIEQLMENAFGAKLAPHIFKDETSRLQLAPEIENEMLLNGYDVDISDLDDDPAHIAAHMAEMENDQTGFLKLHVAKHQQRLLQRQMEASMGQAQANPTSAPAGAGMPQPGSSPAGPSNMQQPPGAIQQDQLGAVDPTVMPRNM